MWNEITYPFPNLSGATVEVWEWMINVTPHLGMLLLSLFGFKLIRVSKNGHWDQGELIQIDFMDQFDDKLTLVQVIGSVPSGNKPLTGP